MILLTSGTTGAPKGAKITGGDPSALKSHPSQVVGQVDIGPLQPHRMVQLQRDVYELVAQRLQQMQATAQRPPEQLEGEITIEVRDFDDADLERVRVDVRGFAAEQHGIPAVESLHCPPHSWTRLTGSDAVYI